MEPLDTQRLSSPDIQSNYRDVRETAPGGVGTRQTFSMTTSKIRSITPGKSFVYKQGPMAGETAFTFKINLEDNVTGEATSKSTNPPYAVGDMVEYEATPGQYGNKLKIKKVGGFTGNYAPGTTPAQAGPQAQQGHSQPQQAPPKQWGGANVGMRTGMAVNCAIRAIGSMDYTTKEAQAKLWKTASVIFRCAESMENGKIWGAEKPEGTTAAVEHDSIPGLDDESF